MSGIDAAYVPPLRDNRPLAWSEDPSAVASGYVIVMLKGILSLITKVVLARVVVTVRVAIWTVNVIENCEAGRLLSLLSSKLFTSVSQCRRLSEHSSAIYAARQNSER